MREVRKQSKNIQPPQHHGDNDQAIQYGFDGSLHRNEALDQLKDHADYDQNHDDVN
jgi:hypothetical protein